MKQLPESCHECAEYGSEFCQECLDELGANFKPEEKIKLSQAIKNIAGGLDSQDER